MINDLKREYFVDIANDITLLLLMICSMLCIYVIKVKYQKLENKVDVLNEIVEKYETEGMSCYE